MGRSEPKDCGDVRCSGCAFSPGAAANLELNSKMKAIACLHGGMLFVCHEEKTRLCGGFVAARASLTASGKIPHDPETAEDFREFAMLMEMFETDEKSQERREELAHLLAGVVERNAMTRDVVLAFIDDDTPPPQSSEVNL